MNRTCPATAPSPLSDPTAASTEGRPALRECRCTSPPRPACRLVEPAVTGFEAVQSLSAQRRLAGPPGQGEHRPLQLLAGGQQGGGHARGLGGAAGHRRDGQLRVAVLHLDGRERHAERVGGDLRLHGRPAHPHLLEAAPHHDGAVDRQPHGDVGVQLDGRMVGRGDAHADEPPAVPHRARLRRPPRPAELLRARARTPPGASGARSFAVESGSWRARCASAARSGRRRARRPARRRPTPARTCRSTRRARA